MRTIVVFGGGGTKGLAHIGAWKAISESRVRVDGIVGTSIGALIGACIAGGMDWRELAPRALSLRRGHIAALNRWAMLPNGIRQPSIFRGERFHDFIAELLPTNSFNALRLPLAFNAVDLDTGRVEWFGTDGRTNVDLVDAVYASCALPVFYPPAEIAGRWFVDGGVADALPLRRAVRLGAGRVIAVDVASDGTGDAEDVISKGLVALHHRVFDIFTAARRREVLEGWDDPPLVHVRPLLADAATFGFNDTKHLLEEGYHATRAALARAEPPGRTVAAA